MKILLIILAAIFLTTVWAALPNPAIAQGEGAATMRNIEKSTVLPSGSSNMGEMPESYVFPGNPASTCGGNKVNADTRAYVFGYHRLDGYCQTNQLLANGDSEAWICARAFCNTCQVEDITASYPAGPFSDVYAVTGKYCPAK